jgi:4-diphosphocytidyl-2-C-methyl-D-erythritol kinase
VILRTRAPGKINLCLYVGPTDPRTGLHTLVSVMEPLSLADDLELAPAFAHARDEVECDGVEGPNLAADALARFREHTGWDGPPVRLRIDKRVPVAAGMGGGSSDAAAALRLVAHLSGHAGDDVAPSIGSDVPALMRTEPAFVAGTGDEVMWVDPLPRHAVVVLPSSPGLSAAEVYAEADRLGLPRGDDALARRREALVEALQDGELPEPVNDLQDAARSLRPAIDDALDALRETGAEHAFVTGSGPTAAGLFLGEDGELRAKGAVARLRDRWPQAAAAAPVDARFGEVTTA